MTIRRFVFSARASLARRLRVSEPAFFLGSALGSHGPKRTSQTPQAWIGS